MIVDLLACVSPWPTIRLRSAVGGGNGSVVLNEHHHTAYEGKNENSKHMRIDVQLYITNSNNNLC